MPRSQIYVFALIFVSAYTLFLYQMYSANKATGTIVAVSPSAQNARPLYDASGKADREEPHRNANAPQTKAPVGEPTPADESAALGAQRLSITALSAPEAETRGVAIQQLSVTSSPEVIYALGEAALRDRVQRNRYLAIESLRTLAANQGGDRNGSIRAALRMAMNDPDKEFAYRAREAYQDVTEFTGEN